jgi:hypothetical protein
MTDEREKRSYDQQWQAREQDRVARNKAARERGKSDFAVRITQRAERLRLERNNGPRPISR